MGKSNKEIVLEFIELCVNEKNLDAITDYVSQDYVYRNPPYVGMGINVDRNLPDKIVILSVKAGGPSDGKLQVGDELLAAEDETDKWETLEALKETSSWGHGKIGTTVKLKIRRDGKEMEVEVTRSKIEGFDVPFNIVIDAFKHYHTVDCPDHKEEVMHIVAEGDIVMTYSQIEGTVTEFDRQAVWTSSTVWRLADGKITEAWGVGPELSYYYQLGYKIERPDS
ncbi:MAG: PDZ domain-containing protein [Anaerolineales bacterium]|nr:MAG: PDZ domain-containing protein [Anaerolineales bacterium]